MEWTNTFYYTFNESEDGMQENSIARPRADCSRVLRIGVILRSLGGDYSHLQAKGLFHRSLSKLENRMWYTLGKACNPMLDRRCLIVIKQCSCVYYQS